MKWRDPETLSIYEHYYNEQKFRDLHEKLQENYLKREKEYAKNSKSNLIEKPSELISDFEILNYQNESEDWLSEFYEGME